MGTIEELTTNTISGETHQDELAVFHPITRITSIHESYNKYFQKFIQPLYYGSGNLPLPLRHFCAIMAASRHRCQFLQDLHTSEFERLGGKLDWLKGLGYVDDPRVAALDELNIFLCHQPWRVNGEWFYELQRRSHWSISELVNAALVMNMTHCMCSMVHAFGISTLSPSSKSDGSSRFDWAQRDKENKAAQQQSEVEELLRRMAVISKNSNPENCDENVNTKHFMALYASDTAEYPLGSDSPDRSDQPCFSFQPSFTYIDFANRSDGTRTFKYHEFPWETTALPIFEEHAVEYAKALDKMIRETQAMTYGFMGGFNNIDTSAFRTAIWNYIQALFGIRHDDYEYSSVNQLLSRDLKTFIKHLVVTPHRLPDDLRTSIMSEFKSSEKVHVVLMITAARLQATMLWLSRAITNYVVAHNKNEELD